MSRLCVMVASLVWITSLAASAADIRIGYLHTPLARMKLSLADMPARDEGLAGAALGIGDDNTTGAFLGQQFTLVDRPVEDGEDLRGAMQELAADGVTFIVAAMPGDLLLAASDAAKGRAQMLFNVTAIDDRLREEDCRNNVVHVAPTRSMLADALAQYLAWKRWSRWVLIAGSHPEDKLFAVALRKAATRFGQKIVAEREFPDTGGARRTDSGLADVQRQMPVLTQGLPDHDVLVAADESEVFAGYLPYRTWTPRPVAGSAGLVPTTWDAAFDQWGAVQLQNRFQREAHRAMSALDLQAWTAVRMVGEAAARANSSEPAAITAFLRSPAFSVAAFKGQSLTLRDWNLQLRQPMLLFDGRNNVSVSPQEGFLHQVSALDTLGVDRPETRCKLH